MGMLTIDMVVDMDQFPRMPPFLDHPLAEEHGSLQPIDEGGNNNEDDEEEEDME